MKEKKIPLTNAVDLIKTIRQNNSQVTFEDRLYDQSKKMYDSFSNSLLGIGNSDKRKKFNEFGLTNDTNNWALWLALYNDSWIFRRAIDKPAQDVVNLNLKFLTEENVDSIKADLNSLKFNLIQLLMWGALFGGAIAVMLFDNVDLNEMEFALKKDQIKESKKIRLVIYDRWNNISPSLDDLILDVKSIDFLKPKYYRVQIGNKAYKIHHSYILRYEHRIAPNLLKNGMLSGWGYSEGVHLINELMRDEKLKNSINSLIDKSLIEVIKMSGMRGVFMGADQDNEIQLRKRLEMVNWGRNFNSLTFLDKDDDYQQNEFGGLSGLSDLMDKNMETIAAALDMTGVLYGDMSGGFSPDNYALVRYDTNIRNRAESYYRPVLEKLLNVLKIKNKFEGDLSFEFDTMIQIKEEDPLDKAQKITGILSQMINDGYMSVAEAAEEINRLKKEIGIGLSLNEHSVDKLKENENLDKEDIDLDEEI